MAKFTFVFALIVALCGPSYAVNVAEKASELGLTTLVELVTKAGLGETLSGEGPFTVFAPTDEAFAQLDPEVLEQLNNDDDLLRRVLLYHVVPANVKSADLEDDSVVDTASEGDQSRINVYLKSKFYDGFVTVNGKRVSKPDQEADNGVVHVVSEVIFPLSEQTIADVLSNDPEQRFTTLIAALEAAELTETFASNEDAFTLYAPTNDAFAQIPEEELQALLEDKEALTAVLTRHVLPKTLFYRGTSWGEHDTLARSEEAEDESNRLQTQVFKGGVIKVVTLDNEETRRSARIVDQDLVATNGVVHVVDAVL